MFDLCFLRSLDVCFLMSSMCFLMSSIVFPHVINCVPSRHQALLKTVTWSSACSRMHTGSPHPVLMRNGDAPSGDTPMDLHASRSTAKHYIILQSERPTYRTIPYNTKLYYTILYYNILYYTILYYTILYYTILYSALPNILQSQRPTYRSIPN